MAVLLHYILFPACTHSLKIFSHREGFGWGCVPFPQWLLFPAPGLGHEGPFLRPLANLRAVWWTGCKWVKTPFITASPEVSVFIPHFAFTDLITLANFFLRCLSQINSVSVLSLLEVSVNSVFWWVNKTCEFAVCQAYLFFCHCMCWTYALSGFLHPKEKFKSNTSLLQKPGKRHKNIKEKIKITHSLPM